MEFEISDDMKAKATLYAKLARVMGKIDKLPKDKTNAFHGYAFTSEGAVSTAVRSLLAEESIAFIPQMMSSEEIDGVWVASFSFTFACGDTGATITSLWQSEAQSRNSKGARDDKGLNKAATAAEKYFLLKTFIIPTGNDPDADGELKNKQSSGAPRPAQQPAPKQAKQPAPPVANASSTPPAKQPSPDDEFDAISSAPQSTPPTDDYKAMAFDRLNLSRKAKGSNDFVYALIGAGRSAHPTLFEGSKLRAAGIDVDGYKAKGAGIYALPKSYTVYAKWDTTRNVWDVREIAEGKAA